MMKATQINILADRPEVPAGWIIFNAPRPIYGTKDWKGEFKEGVFYAAVDPSDSLAQTFIRENLLLRAVVCNYIQISDIVQFGINLCNENGYDIEECDYEDLRRMYFATESQKEIEL